MDALKKWLGCHKKPIAIVCLVLCIAFVARALYKVLYKPPVEKEIPYVRTVTIGKDTTLTEYTYPGEVRGRYESALAFQAGGKIIQRNVSLGDEVRAGQVLMVIDPKDVVQAVNNAQAAVTSAQSQAKLARDNATRYQALYQQGAVSEAVWDQYRTQHEAADAALNQALAQLTTARNKLEYTQLVSDHDGVVSSLSGEVGMVVAAGTPVATVVQAGNREIQIFVPENRLGTIAPNMPCQVTFWALQNTTAQGYIRDIAPMADPNTKTYKVRVALPDMPEAARLGMTAKVTLGSVRATQLLLPRAALYQTGDKTEVWVVKAGKVHLQDVTIGNYQDDSVVITKGLTEGDIVVTGGISKLQDNMEVRLEGGVAQ